MFLIQRPEGQLKLRLRIMWSVRGHHPPSVSCVCRHPNCVCSPQTEREAEASHGDGPEVGGRGGRGRNCLPRCCLPGHRVLQRRRRTVGRDSVSQKVNIKYTKYMHQMWRSEAINQMRTNEGEQQKQDYNYCLNDIEMWDPEQNAKLNQTLMLPFGMASWFILTMNFPIL